jgi:hypothetical protein
MLDNRDAPGAKLPTDLASYSLRLRQPTTASGTLSVEA